MTALAHQQGTEQEKFAALRRLTPSALRCAIRSGQAALPTTGLAPGYLQGNLVILPRQFADDFLKFCLRNPKPCPLIGLSEPGATAIPVLGQDIDLRTDIPAYRVFSSSGEMRKVNDLTGIWRDDLVSFVLGCSYSFEEALLARGIPVRHISAGRNVPMYRTRIQTVSSGPFAGPLVVSMRAFKPGDAIQAIIESARFPLAHGSPVHIGNPEQIGIQDLQHPEFGDAPVIEPDDIPVFWACGVTPQLAIGGCGADLMIVHEPGHMLVTDVPAAAADIHLSGVSNTITSRDVDR